MQCNPDSLYPTAFKFKWERSKKLVGGRRKRCLIFFYCQKIIFLERSNSAWKSKHLKGHLVPRVGNVFGSHFLGELLVTFLDHTFLASCWWRFWITLSWWVLLVTFLDHNFLASCWWHCWITLSWRAVGESFTRYPAEFFWNILKQKSGGLAESSQGLPLNCGIIRRRRDSKAANTWLESGESWCVFNPK